MITKFNKYNLIIDDLPKKLLNHLTNVLNELGFEHVDYIDLRGKDVGEKADNLAVEFYDDNFGYKKYMFALLITSEGNLKVKMSLNKKEKNLFIVDFLRNLTGLKEFKNPYIEHEYNFRIVSDINELINNINVENLEPFINAKKYNL